MTKYILLFLTLMGAGKISATIEPAAIFSDHMVLQSDRPIRIWGKCLNEKEIRITLDSIVLTAEVEDGAFLAVFPPMPAGGPHSIRISGSRTIIIEDVYFGDVYVFGGQSNMEFTTQQIIDAEKELEDADFPEIRMFKVAHDLAPLPKMDVKGGPWMVCDQNSARRFSAIAFLFGRAVHKKHNIPVGLIDNSWGGTDIKGWLPPEGLSGNDSLEMLYQEFVDNPFVYRDKDEWESTWKLNMDLKDIGTYQGWGFPTADRTNWEAAKVPGYWERDGHAAYDGVMWYSTRFDIANKGSDTCMLSLGRIDDSDLVYLNGMVVASTENRYARRLYTLPRNVLFEQGNELAVRIKDIGGNGGFYGSDNEFYCSCGTDTISLAKSWVRKPGTPGYPAYPKEFQANGYPSTRYNAMVHGLTSLAIKGYLYYQGESDERWPEKYQELFWRLIRSYRTAWDDQTLPFLYVQLANYRAMPEKAGQESSWAKLREAQASALRLPYTGMATAIDVGEANDIHPRDKQTVAARLFGLADNIIYEEKVISNGPEVREIIKEELGYRIRFDNAAGGLRRKDYSRSIDGFEVKTEDGVWKKAPVKIISDQTILMEIKDPITEIRYLWADNPGFVNLYNTEGLPALPFQFVLK